MKKILLILVALCWVLFSFIDTGATTDISDLDGIVAVGRSAKGPVVFVEDENTFVPTALSDYEVIVTGKIYRIDQLDFEGFDERYRPAFPSVSVGHYLITAGTFGAVVYKDGTPMILSNNHVLANSDGADAGDPILQPGYYDGGVIGEDTIATLANWVPIPRCTKKQYLNNRCPVGYFDAAVAEITGPVKNEYPVNGETGIGFVEPPTKTTQPYIGQEIYKCGRTTGCTDGLVGYFLDEINVCCYSGFNVKFINQIATYRTMLAKGGDSGSLVRDSQTGDAVGLLFAGNPDMTIFSPIDPVMSALCLSFDPKVRNMCLKHYLPLVKN